MTEKEIKELKDRDKDGLLIYECIANNAGQDDACLPELCKALAEVDLSGQFTASAARFLHAVDSTRYADLVRPLVSATIDLDRERKYLGDLFQCLYGPVEGLDVAAMSAADNNFRRMYKRLFANTAM